jgi:hypothetical protein
VEDLKTKVFWSAASARKPQSGGEKTCDAGFRARTDGHRSSQAKPGMVLRQFPFEGDQVTVSGLTAKWKQCVHKGHLYTFSILGRDASGTICMKTLRCKVTTSFVPRHRNRCGRAEDGRNLRQGICQPIRRCFESHSKTLYAKLVSPLGPMKKTSSPRSAFQRLAHQRQAPHKPSCGAKESRPEGLPKDFRKTILQGMR